MRLRRLVVPQAARNADNDDNLIELEMAVRSFTCDALALTPVIGRYVCSSCLYQITKGEVGDPPPESILSLASRAEREVATTILDIIDPSTTSARLDADTPIVC
jgi:hypothetical protein